MARLGAVNFFDSDFVIETQLSNYRARLFGGGNPLLHVARLRQTQFRVVAQRCQARRHFSDQLLQRALLDIEIIQIRNFFRDREIVLGLRLVGVGDGRGADFKIAFGLRQLFADGFFLRAGQRDVVLRKQHIEIGLRGAHDQGLARVGEHGFGLLHLQSGLVDDDPVRHAK